MPAISSSCTPEPLCFAACQQVSALAAYLKQVRKSTGLQEGAPEEALIPSASAEVTGFVAADDITSANGVAAPATGHTGKPAPLATNASITSSSVGSLGPSQLSGAMSQLRSQIDALVQMSPRAAGKLQVSAASFVSQQQPVIRGSGGTKNSITNERASMAASSELSRQGTSRSCVQEGLNTEQGVTSKGAPEVLRTSAEELASMLLAQSAHLHKQHQQVQGSMPSVLSSSVGGDGVVYVGVFSKQSDPRGVHGISKHISRMDGGSGGQ
jgi:hypothetical protein